MSSINPNYKVKKRASRTVDSYVEEVKNHNKYVLGELITLLESEDKIKKDKGLKILNRLGNDDKLPSLRIGITGSPGVGKSTFINAYVQYLHQSGQKVAVLAVDPSSLPTSGSILGDKTRMADLTSLPNVFIRPSPAGEMLGGIAKGTREAIEACEAAGYDVILVETVGVGQSEHLAAQVVDITVLLLQIGAGDDIQGIKRGIIEMADIFIVNKDDGPHHELVRKTLSYYKQALSFINKRYDVKYKRVLSCSSLEQKGFDQIDHSIQTLFKFLKHSNTLFEERLRKDKLWLNNMIKEYALYKMSHQPIMNELNTKLSSEKTLDVLSKFELYKEKINELFPNN